MSEIAIAAKAANGLWLLRNMFAKTFVKDQDIKKILIDDLGRVDMKVDILLLKDLQVARKYLADGLDIEDSDPTEADKAYDKACDNSLKAIGVVQEPLQKIESIQIAVTSLIKRCSLGKISEETAKKLVARRLNHVNEMEDILTVIKRRIIGSSRLQTFKSDVGDIMQKLLGTFKVTKDTSTFDKADADYVVIMEICRVYMTAIMYFDDPVSFHDTIKFDIPRENNKNKPYQRSIGYLLLATADRVAGKWASYENDILYHQRQMMYMLPMVEFAVKELGLPDGCKWHDSEELGTNVAILDRTRRYRFVNCNILKVQDSGNIKDGAEIVEEGEQVEVIEVGECGKVRVRRNKHEGGFELDEKCVDIAEVEKQYQEILANNKLF